MGQNLQISILGSKEFLSATKLGNGCKSAKLYFRVLSFYWELLSEFPNIGYKYVGRYEKNTNKKERERDQTEREGREKEKREGDIERTIGKRGKHF